MQNTPYQNTAQCPDDDSIKPEMKIDVVEMDTDEVQYIPSLNLKTVIATLKHTSNGSVVR